MMILDLHRQGLSPTAIARQLGIDRKTVRKYIARGMEPPNYRTPPRRPRCTDAFLPYLAERLATYPGLSAVRLMRELRERGFVGGYTAVKRAIQEMRPQPKRRLEMRFETPPGEQAQVDFARFEVAFTEEPGVTRIVWLFSMVLGFSRLIWGRFVIHQNLHSVLRCHVAAFTSNRGLAEWGEVFGDPVVATALLDRLLHHAVVVQIEGASYRLRQHAGLVPEHIRSKALIHPPSIVAPPKRRGRPPKTAAVVTSAA